MNWKTVLIILLWGWVMLLSKSDLVLILNRCLPPTEAGLLGGIVLGEKGGIFGSNIDDLRKSGLIHLVVASGGNIMLIVGGLIESLAGWFGRKKSIVVGLTLGWRYVTWIGWEIPVVRAMLLMSVVYWAQILGRKYNLLRGLVGCVLVMILGEPKVVLSVSFWLSLVAFLGVISYQRPVRRNRKWWKEVMVKIWEAGGETVWVTVWILPILALVFKEVSVVAPITNLMVVGLVQLVTVLGILGVLLGVIVAELGRVVLWLTVPLLRYLLEISRLGASWNSWKVSFNWMMLVGYYLTLGGYLWSRKRE